MKFVISLSELNNIIGKIQNVVATKPTIPILSNFSIEATASGELIFMATDLTVGIRFDTEAKILKPGSSTLPAKRFFQLIRELTVANSTANVEISVDSNDVAEICSGTSVFKLKGMDKSEYPSLPDLDGAVKLRMKQSVLREMFFRTSFAVSREDNRYVLTGVLMQVNNGVATFVGTDGKRLVRAYTEDIEIDPSFVGEFIVPLKAVEESTKTLREEGDATVYLMSDKVAVEANGATIITKLLAGDYPDYQRVIPEDTGIAVTLHREELMTLLRQVSLFTTESSQSVRFSFSQGDLQLSANNPEGEGKVSMAVNYGQADPLTIAFNPDFFLDILKHSKDETVNLGMADSFNPGVITDSSSALCVIMPMRLNTAVEA